VTSHLDTGVLADYREGLLSRRRSARISAHLTRCARCSSLDADLAEVSTLLASAPTPAMPAHLVARLETALAAEAAALAATPGGGTVGSGHDAAGTANGEAGTRNGAAPGPAGEPDRRRPLGPIRRRPDRPARSAQWRTGLLGAAAVIAVILVVGVYGLVKLAGQGGSSSTASSGAAMPRNGSHSFGSRGGPAVSPAGQAGPNKTLLPAGKLRLTSSGTDYQPGTLASQVASVLASSPDMRRLAPADATPSSASSRTEDQLRACVTQITGGVPPRLVDQAHYQGQPATIIVQAAAGGRPQQVWVVGPACSAGHPDLIAHTELTGQG
jgi:hypothetical protein